MRPAICGNIGSDLSEPTLPQKSEAATKDAAPTCRRLLTYFCYFEQARILAPLWRAYALEAGLIVKKTHTAADSPHTWPCRGKGRKSLRPIVT